MHRFQKMIITLFILFILVVGFAIYYQKISRPNLTLSKTSFDRLTNWKADDHTEAFLAFRESCGEILKRKSNASYSGLSQAGQTGDWQVICSAANKLVKPDDLTAKHFFETWFVPYAVKDNFSSQGLFTGYYLPSLHASLKKDKQYSIPIYALPSDLIKINLGLFRPEFSGKKIIAQMKNRELIPYPNRAEINAGKIDKDAKVLAWSDSLIDVFFAQIQGSALVQLSNGKQVLIGYDGENGQPYRPIGKVLIENNALTKQSVSMQTIRAWLLAHPEESSSILNHDASYVFFRFLKGNKPLGSEQIPLTPRRSLAVDPHYIPLGSPIWLDTMVPQNNANTPLVPFKHLMIAQDTGGSIKGIIRADVYWGAGEEAAYIAGHMKSKGKYWILLPLHKFSDI